MGKQATNRRTGNMNAVFKGGGSVRTISSRDVVEVGRPGFKTRWAAPPRLGTRASVRRLGYGLTDPNDGVLNPLNGRDVAIGTGNPQNNDINGPVRPTILGANGGSRAQAQTRLGVPIGQGKSVIRPPRASAPVRSGTPGKVTRPSGSQIRRGRR